MYKGSRKRTFRNNPEGNPQDAVYYQHGCRFVILLPDGRTVYARTEQAALKQNGEVQELWQDGDQIVRRQQSAGEAPALGPDPYPVGFSWESPNGLRTIRARQQQGENTMALVQTGEGPFRQIIDLEKLPAEIHCDTANLAYREKVAKRLQEQEAIEAVLEAERTDIDGFADDLSPLRRGRIVEALSVLMTVGGSLKSRKEHVRDLVAEGYRIAQVPAGETWLLHRRKGLEDVQIPVGSRILQNETGGFFTEKDLTKTALDYAEFLLHKGKR